jgi:NADH-quinone oxidoreductase subunit M
MIVSLSSLGLPGLNNFVGEFLILMGAFGPMTGLTVAAAVGVIFAAVYMLWMFQRVMFGTVTNEKNRHLPDMNAREVAYMLPLLLFVFWIGLYPQTFLRKMEASVSAVVTRMEEKRKAVLAERPPGETLLARYFDRAPD